MINMFDFQELVQLIPIAVIISIIVFLVRFFGKAISDQVPFADDRKWHEDLSGIMFFSNYILSPITLVAILYLRGFKFWLFPKEDLFIILISLAVFISLSITSRKSTAFLRNNKFTEGNYLELLKKSFRNNNKKDFGDSMIYYRFLFFPIVSLGIIYLLTLFYQWGSYYYLLIALIYLFFHLTSFAIFTSLLRRNIFVANIKFIDKSIKSINKCRVLKVNDDNIRILYKNKVFIINKSSVLRIERIT